MWSGASQAYINPLNFHLQGMLWSGEFVAKGKKGDCIALQEEVRVFILILHRLQASELLEEVLLCFG